MCVFCFGFFPLYKQLQKAILHLPTLELSIETAQTEELQKKKNLTKNPNNSNDENVQTNFGIDVHPLSSSNKQYLMLSFFVMSV